MPPIAPSLTEKNSAQKHSYPPTPTSPESPPGLEDHQCEDGDESDDGQTLSFPTHKDDLEFARNAPDSPAIVLNLPPRATGADNTPANDTMPTSTMPRPWSAPPVPITIPRSPASSYGFDWDAPSVSAKPISSASMKRVSSSPTSFLFASSSPRSSSPTSLAQMGAKFTPIFAPLTRVVNPLIVRAMAEVVRRSTFWGALFGLFLTALCFILPFQGHNWSYGW